MKFFRETNAERRIREVEEYSRAKRKLEEMHSLSAAISKSAIAAAAAAAANNTVTGEKLPQTTFGHLPPPPPASLLNLSAAAAVGGGVSTNNADDPPLSPLSGIDGKIGGGGGAITPPLKCKFPPTTSCAITSTGPAIFRPPGNYFCWGSMIIFNFDTDSQFKIVIFF